MKTLPVCLIRSEPAGSALKSHRRSREGLGAPAVTHAELAGLRRRKNQREPRSVATKKSPAQVTEPGFCDF
jgi:hypothetical protein